MMSVSAAIQRHILLATALATPRDKRIQLTLGCIAFALFILAVPFTRVHLAPVPAFIPTYEAALFFIDLITAVVLFDQFLRLKSIAFLVLAAGYLFDALIIVPHALSFIGAFSATGLLGAQAQTTAWLYVFWHGGFPLFVIAYALLRDRNVARADKRAAANPFWCVAAAIVGVTVLVASLTLLATWGHDLLPVVMRGGDYSLLVRKGISPAVWLLTLAAMIALWRREQRTVDLWLMLVMWVWLFDIALSAVIGSSRFDLGFYAGRIFGLIAASFLLVTLIVAMARLYAGAVRIAANAERKLARRAHRRNRSEPTPIPRERHGSFVNRQNIARYRALLAARGLDDEQRRAIETLLIEEEERAHGTRSKA